MLSVHGHCSAEFSCTMYSTIAVAAVAMCWLLPISVDAIGLRVNPRYPVTGAENNVRLQCEGTAMATFYRMDMYSAGSADEEQLSNTTVINYNEESPVVVTFVLDGPTEGLYFCRSGGDESPKRELVAYPPHLNSQRPRPLNAAWGSPFTVDCPYNIGVLREQYTMEWTVIGPADVLSVTSNSESSDYQLAGSSLMISKFTPFIKRLICRLTVRGTDDFRLLQEPEIRYFNFQPITVKPVCFGTSTITQAPSDTRASDSGTAEFECVASVPQNHEVEFEMFGETITTNDTISCVTTKPSFTKRRCIKQITRNILGNISHHSMALSCDYSIGYQISCLLRVDNLTTKDKSNVTCRILDDSTSEATRTAKLLADSLTMPEPSQVLPNSTDPSTGLQNTIFGSITSTIRFCGTSSTIDENVSSASTIPDVSAGHVLTTATDHSSTVQYHSIKEPVITVSASTILVNAGHVFTMATDQTVMISSSTILVSAGQAMVTEQTGGDMSALTVTMTSVVFGEAIFFIVVIFTIILAAIFYRNKRRKNVKRLEAIYEPIIIDLPSIPPQLPPRQPCQVSMQDNPAYVQVDLTVNPAYKSIKNETMFNSVSGALTVAVSHKEEECTDDTTSGYEEIVESTELSEAGDDQQSPHIKLRTAEAEDSLPLPTMHNMIVGDYDKLPSAAVLKSTLNPVSTMVSATNLTVDGAQEGKYGACHFSVGEKKTLRNAHSDTNILQSMIDEHLIIRFSSADNFPL